MMYQPCSLSDVKVGDNVMVLGHTTDMATGQERFDWRGIEVGQLDSIDGSYMIDGFEFQHRHDGSREFLGPCSFTNIDYAMKLGTVYDLGLERAIDILHDGVGLMNNDVQIERSGHEQGIVLGE
jgi:hypothetical protein